MSGESDGTESPILESSTVQSPPAQPPSNLTLSIVWLGWVLATMAATTLALSVASLTWLLLFPGLVQSLPLSMGLGRQGTRGRLAARWVLSSLGGGLLGVTSGAAKND